MTVAVTATVFGTTPSRPTVQITITGLTLGDQIDLTRQAPSEPAFRVRGGVRRIADSATMVITDTTPSLDRLVTYSVTRNGAFAASANVTVPFTGHHLLTDAATGQGIIVDVLLDDDARTQAARANVLQPKGSAYAVVLYDTRTSDAGTLQVYTPDRTTTQALRDLVKPGRPIASRHRNDGCDIDSLEYLYPLDVVRRRFTRAGDRLWEFPFIAVDVPMVRTPVVVVTLQDVADYYLPTGGTLATMSGQFATFLDAAQFPFGVL